jgi:hypothetical protein
LRPWYEAQETIIIDSNNFSTAVGILFDEDQLPEGLEKDTLYFYHQSLMAIQQVHKTTVWTVWEKDRWLEHVASMPVVEYLTVVNDRADLISGKKQEETSLIYTPER